MSVPLVATAALLRDSDVVVSPMLPPKAANDQRLPSIRELLGDLDPGREKKRRSASMPSIEHEAAAAIAHQLQTAHHQPQYSLHNHHEAESAHQRPSTPPGADRLQSLERQLHVLKQQKDILERMVAKQEHFQQQQRRHSVTGAVWAVEHLPHPHQPVPHSAHRATSSPPPAPVLSPNCPDLAAPHHQWATFESGTRGTLSVDVGPQPGHHHNHYHQQQRHHHQHDPHRHHVPPQPLEQQPHHHHHPPYPYHAQQHHHQYHYSHYHHHHQQHQHAVVGHAPRRMSPGPAERGDLALVAAAAAAATAASSSSPPPPVKETSSSRKRKERALSAADEAALRAAAASVLEFHQYCPSCKKGSSSSQRSGEATRPCTCGRRASLGAALSRGSSSSDVIADVQDDRCFQLERSRSPSTMTSAEEGANRRDVSFKRRKSVAALPTAPPRTKHVTFHKLEFM